MHPKLSQYINRTVLISIPSLFADGHARPFKLLGVELHGLWLQSDELAKRLLHADQSIYSTMGPVVFVPFAQIASVLFSTRQPSPVEAPAAPQPKDKATKAEPTSRATMPPENRAVKTRPRNKSG